MTTTRKENRLSEDHDDLLTEALITYNNSIHSATKLTPFELFFGRTFKFNKTITYNNEHEYLPRLNEFQNTLYPLVKEKMKKDKTVELTD